MIRKWMAPISHRRPKSRYRAGRTPAQAEGEREAIDEALERATRAKAGESVAAGANEEAQAEGAKRGEKSQAA